MTLTYHIHADDNNILVFVRIKHTLTIVKAKLNVLHMSMSNSFTPTICSNFVFVLQNSISPSSTSGSSIEQNSDDNQEIDSPYVSTRDMSLLSVLSDFVDRL